jgi:hypothetical protein
MRILIGAAAAALLALSVPARADIVGAAVQAYGLVGTWSNDCSRNLEKHQAGLRITFEVPEKGPPIRTVISSDGAKTTTVKAEVLSAVPLGTGDLNIRVRLMSGAGGDAPLPAYLNTPEQSFQKTEPNVLFIKGPYAVRLGRCTE